MAGSIVYELAFARSTVARSLFEHPTFDRTLADSYFEGRQGGRLFVDDPAQPAGALLCRSYDYFLSGEPAKELEQFIADAPAEAGVFDVVRDLNAARRTQTIAFYGYVPMTLAWHDALIAIHGDRLEAIGRRSFRYDRSNAGEAASRHSVVPDGFEVMPIDAALAERIDTELGDVIGLMWGGYQRFGDGGFGACAMSGNEIASMAYTLSVSGSEINIGVETPAKFRRRGLASIVSLKCIDQALERGLVPTWDCDAENEASAALALSLGFTELPSFIELAFPKRAGPTMSTGMWSSQVTAEGIAWRRREAEPIRF